MAADFDPNAPTRPDPTGAGAAPESPTGPRLIGRKLGAYLLLREVGRGGMGVVYLAHDESLQRDVAVKVLQQRLASDPEFERRFVREARSSAKLDHPNVVPVYTAGRDGDVLYMAMPFIKGRTLDALMKERGRLPVREALEIVRQAARGLGAAHQASLVHRDIKPHNIMIDAAGCVKIMDFGLMRSWREAEAITEPGVFYGTPEYASPEQCEGNDLDGRADLYSLGAVFYEMLGGRRPHAGNTPMALFRKILEETPTTIRSLNPDVTPAVAGVLEKMMAKRREDRYATAEELVEALGAVLDGSGPSPAPRRRGRIAGVVGLLLLLAGAVWTLWPRGAPAPVPPPPSGRMRLVVFDLKNGIPRAESAWYSIALSDLLIASLSKRPDLDVPTRDLLLWTLKQRELAGKASEDERRALTGDLGAQAYLSGSYYAQAGKIRLTLAAYKLPENSLLFPELSFDRTEDDLFGLVDEAAGTVSTALATAGGGALALAEPKQQADRSLRRESSSLREADKAGEEGASAKRIQSAAPAALAEAPPAPPAAQSAARPLVQDRMPMEKADAVLPGEWIQAWYENRKALENGRLKKEEFETAAAMLSQEFHRKAPPRAAAMAGALKEVSAPATGVPVRLEFGCPACGASLPGFSRCPNDKRFAVVRPKNP